MKDLNTFDLTALELHETIDIVGGGPLKDGISTYFQTLGSFYSGLWDGLVGNKPAIPIN